MTQIEAESKIGVPICSAIELTDAQYDKAMEHVLIQGKVTVIQKPNGRMLYSAEHKTDRTTTFLPVSMDNSALQKKLGKKNPGKYTPRHFRQ